MIDDQEKAKEKRDKRAADEKNGILPKILPKKDTAATDKKEVPLVIKTEAEMEADARKKVLKVHDDWFKRLKELKPEDLYATYLNAITTAYDPHSNYMAPEQKKDFDINMSGKLEGIGATLQTKDSYVRVTSLVAGGPAWKTGKLNVDDLIMKVAQATAEPVDVTDMGINDVIKMIRGKKGTEVRLTVKKTVFYKVHWAMFIGGGRDHRVVNNLFVDCDPAVRADGRGLDQSPVWHNMVNDTMRQRLAEVPLALYRRRYPEMKSLDRYYGPPGGPAITGEAFKGVPPDDNLIERNVCVGKWMDVGWHATANTLRREGNLTNAAPSLAALPNDQSSAKDFALRKDSPAWGLGFQRIPVEEIGLREDDLRRGLKRLSTASTQ